MKVRIRKYPTWLGPYQLVEKICFWAKKDDEYPEWVFDLGDKLAHSRVGGHVSRAAEAYLQFQHDRRVRVTIDAHDVWSMDHTLGYIVLPMLKQLKETKQGSPHVDVEDVPQELQLHGGSSNELSQYDLFYSDEHDNMCWDAIHARWEWVMGEMIFAFETVVGEHEDWQEQFTSGEHDIQWIEHENGMSQMTQGPNHTYKIDMEGMTAYQKRISNGFRLFGKYFQSLWD